MPIFRGQGLNYSLFDSQYKNIIIHNKARLSFLYPSRRHIKKERVPPDYATPQGYHTLQSNTALDDTPLGGAQYSCVALVLTNEGQVIVCDANAQTNLNTELDSVMLKEPTLPSSNLLVCDSLKV